MQANHFIVSNVENFECDDREYNIHLQISVESFMILVLIFLALSLKSLPE